ncbi:MAG: alpha/beta hydrolase [Planctomycetia bacterium]|nr:alpha/beta hydrolase [Planctomycetia bacterium]
MRRRLTMVATVVITVGVMIVPPLAIAQSRTQTPAVPVKEYRDLEYARVGDHSLRLDLFVPAAEESPPLVVWIHGGAWMGGDRKWCPLGYLTQEGFAVASIDYRLVPAVFPAQIHDCKGAIRWLRAHALEYGIRTEKIGVGGDSAGGHLACLVGTSGGVASLEGDIGGHTDQSSTVQAVCDWYGPTDLLTMDTQLPDDPRLRTHNLPGAPEARLLGVERVQEAPEKAAQASPLTYVDASDPPFLVLHGEKDPVVPTLQSVQLTESLCRNNVSLELHLIPDTGHGGPAFDTPRMRQTIRRFFDRTLR